MCWIATSAVHRFKWDSSCCESCRHCDRFTLKRINAFCGQSLLSEHLSTSLVIFFYPLQYVPNCVLHSGHIWTTSLTDFTKKGTKQHPKWHPKAHNSPASAQFTLLARYSMHVMTWMPHEVQFTVAGTSSSLAVGWASKILHWQDSWKLLLTVDTELEGKQITSGDNLLLTLDADFTTHSLVFLEWRVKLEKTLSMPWERPK